MEKNENDVKVKSPILERILKREKTHCKPVSLIMVPIILIGLVILTLLRGNSRVDSIAGVESCSALSFVLLAMLILFMVGATVINIILVKKEYKQKTKNGYEFIEGDLQWTPKLLTQFMLAAVIAGFIAGCVGLGGGVIFNPLLLSFKVPPSVSSATGMYMIMFTTLANSFQYLLSGYLHLGFAFWCAAWTIVGT